MNSSNGRLLAALAAVTLWSTNAYGADLALGEMGLGWLLLVQFTTASAALLVVRAVQDRRHVRTDVASSSATQRERPDRTAIVIGVVGLTGTTFLQYLAFATAPIVAANVLAYAWPLLAAVWLAITRRNRHASVSAGLALLGFGGIGLIFTGPSQSTAEAAIAAAPWGYVAALGSAVCMAIYTLGASRRPTTTSSSVLIPATLAGAAAAVVLTALGDGPAPTVTGVVAAAYLGLGPMAAGYALWTRAMTGGGAERLSPLGYATPLLSTVLLLATGADAGQRTFLGAGLVLGCSVGVLAYDRHATRSGSAVG
ncbi:MAG: EamA family transporter [Geodermatophilaceae bacterium]|nr:EamA family transporter [Geodermatophilaceae bacterium]